MINKAHLMEHLIVPAKLPIENGPATIRRIHRPYAHPTQLLIPNFEALNATIRWTQHNIWNPERIFHIFLNF
jgi:hypothetical protein